VGELGSRRTRKIMTAQSAVTYAAPGYLLFRQTGKISAQRIDPRTLRLIGNPIPILDAPPGTDLDAEPVASASDDGHLLVLENTPPNRRLGWIDRNGNALGALALPAGTWGRPVLSPDDRFAVVPKDDDLWRIDLVRSVPPLRLTSGGGYHNAPVWSPDGSRIAYTEGGKGREEIYVRRADGAGEPELVPTTDDLFKVASDWCREGLIVNPIRNQTSRDIVLVPYPDKGPVRPLVQTGFAEADARLSPDARWIAYYSNEAGNPVDLYLQSFPDGTRKTRVSSGGAYLFWWMPGSDELCYRTFNRTHLISVALVRRAEEIEVGEPRVLFRFATDVDWSEFTHDGRRLLVATSSDAQHRKAHVVLNWTAMAGRR
jgi:hypothetical protein